jgi:DnaJ family protein C protein 17
MSSNNANKLPDKDPFDVLRVSMEASAAEINKAYRKLALKLHPDKQQNVSEQERKKMAQEFQDIQQARAFLLDVEFESARAKYMTKLASQRLRKAANEARERNMSENRKRMRDELRQQELQAEKHSNDRRKKRNEADVVAGLRKEGNKMRDELANKAAAQEEAKEIQKKEATEQRQVRLKWSRKKITISPSDDSLVNLLQRFGKVEQVEMLGSKGNAALVTFSDAASVSPCVDFYKDSDEMRATYVGKLKEKVDSRDYHVDDITQAKKFERDAETIGDWKLRREAEREALLRQMEEEENVSTNNVEASAMGRKTQKQSSSHRVPFPPHFPNAYDGIEPIEKLERAEENLLSGLVPKSLLEKLRV